MINQYIQRVIKLSTITLTTKTLDLNHLDESSKINQIVQRAIKLSTITLTVMI